MKSVIHNLMGDPMRKLIKNHTGSSISETTASRNGYPAVGLAGSGHPSGMKSWILEPGAGCWSLEIGKRSLEVRNWNLKAGSCILEAPEPFGRSNAGPRSRSLVNVARWTRGPNILIDKRAGPPAA